MRLHIIIIYICLFALTACQPSAETPVTPPEAAWVEARTNLSAEVAVYRPTWLPERFDDPPVLDYVSNQGDATGVTYRIAYRSSAGEMVHFALGPVNSARPETSESIQVLDQDGTLSTTSGWPTFDMTWTEEQRVYSIHASGAEVTRAEMLQIAEGLQLVE